MKPLCEHINNENERDCDEEAEAVCECCGIPMCNQHARTRCQWGGERFIDLD